MPSNLEAISLCHLQCFSNSFSAKLGLPYIIKTFEWFLLADNRFLFHVIYDDKIIGYCGGFSPQFVGDGSTSGILQYAMKRAVTGVIKKPWLLLNKELFQFYPLITKNIFRKIFKPGKNFQPINTTAVTPFESRTGLVVIGIHPSFRGKGVFEMLMNEFEKETTKRQLSTMVLSVKRNNARAIHAYKKAGWLVYKTNEQSLEMRKTIA